MEDQAMATDPRKRQRKLERRASKRKEKKHSLVREQSAGLATRVESAAKWPPLHAWVSDVVWEEGIGAVVVSRALPSGSVAVANFLVDRYCLGVKDAYVQIVSRLEYEDRFLREIRSQYPARDVSFAYARKLVEDSVAYAESLGLHPHADYRVARLLFSDVDPGECKEEFEFGQEGKPFFVAGPYDSPARCRQIVGTLAECCGVGNFEYVIPFGDPNFVPASVRRLEDRSDLDMEDEFDEEPERRWGGGAR
jgi:hypothetical protein